MARLSEKNKNLSFVPALSSKDMAGFIKINSISAGVPSGWIEADGSAVSRTTYADLFAAIGTEFGIGDGATTFNVPSLAAPGAGLEYIIKAYPDLLGVAVGVDNLTADAVTIRTESQTSETIASGFARIFTDYVVAASHTITVGGVLTVIGTLAVDGSIDLTSGSLRIV